jgi:formylglycine-generating enzyme required for sulfatase activity
MVLVHGWFCPILRYVCLRYVDEAEYRCAEYARDRPCLGEPDLRRFCIDRYEWPNRLGANPTVYVSWHEAKRSCASVGKRLCRRSEWVLACEGPKRLPYPWGYDRQPSPCNIDRSPVPFDVGALADEQTRESELARLWQADPIGSHPDCVSSFGVVDMSGNVDEWTDNQADNPGTGRPSTLNGGYWGPVRDTCRLTTKKHGPKFRFYQVGFRCCQDPLDGVSRTAAGEVRAPRPWVEPERSRPQPGGGPSPSADRGPYEIED